MAFGLLQGLHIASAVYKQTKISDERMIRQTSRENCDVYGLSKGSQTYKTVLFFLYILEEKNLGKLGPKIRIFFFFKKSCV